MAHRLSCSEPHGINKKNFEQYLGPLKESSANQNLIFSWHAFFIYIIFIAVELPYNVVLVFAEQCSESVIGIHISPLF